MAKDLIILHWKICLYHHNHKYHVMTTITNFCIKRSKKYVPAFLTVCLSGDWSKKGISYE